MMQEVRILYPQKALFSKLVQPSFFLFEKVPGVSPKAPVSRAQSIQPQTQLADDEVVEISAYQLSSLPRLPRLPSAERLAAEKPLEKPQEKPNGKLPETPGNKKRNERKEDPVEPVEVGKDLLALAEGSDLMDFFQGGFR